MGTTAIGSQARAFGVSSVALGEFSVAVEANTVSIGDVSMERRIVNLAQGAVSATSTEAMNGAQLFGTNAAVGNA